jgi:hypothetical protein
VLLFSTRGGTKVGSWSLEACDTVDKDADWTGWTDSDKPGSDMTDCDAQHDPGAPHLDHYLLASFQCDNSSCDTPQAP